MRGSSPIHRLSATWGLAGLVPIAVLLFQEDLTLLDAGFRAVAVLAAVVALRWLADRVVRGLAATLDPHSDGAAAPLDGEPG